MSDDGEALQSAAPAEIQQKALGMGWIPPERFKGDREKFVDADVYVERGEHVLPIMKATNERLRGELVATQGKVQELTQAVQQANEAIAALKEYQGESEKAAVAAARRALMREIAAAREAGDLELEVELQAKVGELTIQSRKAESPVPTPTPQQRQAPPVHPDFAAWRADNAGWYGVDKDLTVLTASYAERLRADPANNGLEGRPFWDRAAADARKALYGNKAPAPSKVEGSGGGGAGSGGGGGTGFSALPAEARRYANDPATLKKMVGEGKAFKTTAEWHAHYAKHYQGDE